MPLLRGRALQLGAGSSAGMFVMIALTAIVTVLAGQVMATALGAPGAGRFAAADAVVRAHATVTLGRGDNAETVTVQRSALLPPAAVRRVAAVSGVAAATGDVAFPVAVIGRDGSPLPSRGGVPAYGLGWPSAILTPYRLTRGRAPAAPSQIVLDEELARVGHLSIGDRVRVIAPTGPVVLRVVGVAAASSAQEALRSSVFVTQTEAQALSGLGGGFDAIAVRARPGVDAGALRTRIHDAVGGGAQVLDHRHAAAADAGDPSALNRVELVAIVASGGGITLGIAVFVLAGTVAFAAEGRRREIALLRAVGATPGQVRWMLVREIALIGLLAGVAGCLAGSALLGVASDALRAVGLAPDGFAVAPNWIPYAIGGSVGVAVALLATLLAAHRALAVRPGEALLQASVPARRLSVVRLLLGFVALGGGLTLVVVLSSQALAFATLAAFCFAIGVALLGPVALGWPAALAGWALARLGGGSGFLAGTALASGRFRIGAVGAAVALVVALAGTQVVDLATARHATDRVTAARVLAPQVIASRGGGGLPPSVAADAARLPGARAVGVVTTDVFLLDRGLGNSGDSWHAAGLDPGAAAGLLDLGIVSGSLGAVRGDSHSVAVSETVARAGGLHVGDVLHARMADATPESLRVAAIYRRANGLGDVVLAHGLALAHAAAALDAEVFVGRGGPSVERGLRAIVRRVPTALVRSRSAFLGDVRVADEQNARAQWLIAALMIGIAMMAAFNTGAMAAVERRRELVLARLSGATRRQVVGALTLESLLIALAGVGVGVGIVFASLARAGSDPTGGPLVVPLGQAALVLGGAGMLGVIGMLVPAALIGRARLTALAGLWE
jgi:putative ABC transport system permease protein